MLELSLSGALIRTELLGEDFTGLEVQLGELWIPAAVVRHVPGALAIEWLQFAPEAVSEALDGLRGLSTQLGAAAA